MSLNLMDMAMLFLAPLVGRLMAVSVNRSDLACCWRPDLSLRPDHKTFKSGIFQPGSGLKKFSNILQLTISAPLYKDEKRILILMEILSLAVVVWALYTQDGDRVYITIFLGWALLLLSMIDIRFFLLLDSITLPLIALGVFVNIYHTPDLASEFIVGALCGYIFFAAFSKIFFFIRKYPGLGLGDAKLLAAGGAWLGWQALPMLVVLSCIAALIFIVVRKAIYKTPPGTPLAFGPALSAGIWFLHTLASAPASSFPNI